MQKSFLKIAKIALWAKEKIKKLTAIF